MSVIRRVPPPGLTENQLKLVERHRTGLVRLAARLAARNGVVPAEVMLLLADSKGRIGRALARAVPGPTIGPVVLPGRAAELDGWVASLAVHGPVWDLRRESTGISVIVIDADDAMAVTRA